MIQPFTNENSKTILLAATILSVGLVLGAFFLGNQTKMIGSGRATVTVKGLAEKPIKADYAEWQISTSARGKTFAEALQNLRKEKTVTDQFLKKQGFSTQVRKDANEEVSPYYIEKEVGDRTIREQDGFGASQAIIITTKDLAMIGKAHAAVLDYMAGGANISYGSPQYLVSTLEEIKMSLISDATENARARAKEFIKHGDTQLGSMRSASQGSFYILPDSANSEASEYGGTYDKTTVDKIARVVVTIEFNLK